MKQILKESIEKQFAEGFSSETSKDKGRDTISQV